MYARDSEISVPLNKGFIYSIYRPPALQNIYKYTNDNIIHLLTKKKQQQQNKTSFYKHGAKNLLKLFKWNFQKNATIDKV